MRTFIFENSFETDSHKAMRNNRPTHNFETLTRQMIHTNSYYVVHKLLSTKMEKIDRNFGLHDVSLHCRRVFIRKSHLAYHIKKSEQVFFSIKQKGTVAYGLALTKLQLVPIFEFIDDYTSDENGLRPILDELRGLCIKNQTYVNFFYHSQVKSPFQMTSKS